MVRTIARKHTTYWNPERPATPLVLDSLFDEMEIGTSGREVDTEARVATQRFCIDAIAESVCSGADLRIGRLEQIARVFYEGYRVGWRERTIQSIR